MSEAIRILHVLTAMNMAGTETLLMNFYRNIDRNTIQFDFAVSATNECAYDKEIEELGGRIIHYPKYTGKNHFQYVKWWNRFLVEHPEYHIIHGHIGSTAAIYLNLAKKCGRFTIAHSHSTEPALSIYSLFYKAYSYPTRFIADQFFGCSKKALIDRYGKRVANNSNAKVINNAIDARKFVYNPNTRKRIREEYRILPDETVLVTVGRLTPPKNPHEIIRICHGLKEDGVDFRFLWYGTGELENEIKQEVKAQNLEDVIQFMNTRNDIYNVLQAADVFLFPSVWEGLGIACVEAQAAGLPTFCSNTIPDEARVTKLSKFLPLNDTKTWCKEIEACIKKISMDDYVRPNTYNEVVQAGYDIKETVKWLEDFYNSKW